MVETDIDNIGAIIVEPVQGEGGFQLLSPTFAQYLRKFCDEHGMLLIMDEIQSGYGRTGTPFAFTHLEIEPDLILLGKSIAGGLPLGAVIGKASVVNGLPKGSLGVHLFGQSQLLAPLPMPRLISCKPMTFGSQPSIMPRRLRRPSANGNKKVSHLGYLVLRVSVRCAVLSCVILSTDVHP